MTARCHSCGSEYLTARALAGKVVACRSCGSLNDGAGGPPPAQSDRRKAGGKPRPFAGPAFSIGGDLPAVDADAAEQAAREAVDRLPDPRRVNFMNRAVLGLGFGAALVAVIVIGGVLVINYLKHSDGSRDWSQEMMATPQIVTETASGSGFLIEVDRRYWLVTNLHVIDSAEEVDVIFPDPKTGREIFRIADQPARDFRVHHRFLDSALESRDGMTFDVAALPVDSHRPGLDAVGVKPLALLSLNAVRTGQKVFALGHPGTIFAFGDPSERGATHTARHTLTAGLVSSIRRDAGRPIVVQTDAAINNGNSGGPLLSQGGEVVAVNTWGDVQVKSGGQTESRQGMAFSLAVEHALEVIEQGATMHALRQELERRAKLNTDDQPSLQGQNEEAAWPTFDALREPFGRARGEGWSWQSRVILATGPDGRYIGHYSPTTTGAAEILVLALPKLPSIDLDIAGVADAAGTSLGEDRDSDPGNAAEVRISAAQRPAGGPVTVEIGTFVGNRGVPAEFVILIFERGASQPAAPAAPVIPPAPVTPSGPAPSPPSTPPLPAAPPPAPAAPGPPVGPGAVPAGNSKAGVIELKDGMVDTVYASSLIGLREFDRRFLTNVSGEKAMEAVGDAFVDATHHIFDGDPDFFDVDPDFARDIMRASLIRSFLFPVANGRTLDQSRPLFEALLGQVPLGTRVGVYLEVDAAMRRYFALPSDGLVSKSSDIKLEAGGQSDAYRHDDASGVFRISLELPWNDDELHKLQQAVEIPYSLVVRYDDGSEDRLTGRVRVNPVPQVEGAYPFGLGFAALVDENHPWIKRIIDQINQRAEVKAAGVEITGGVGSPERQLDSIALVWDELVSRGLRYQSLTAADGVAQRCRLVHESLGSANANCIDGTILLASFLQAMGIESYIALMPGHALLCADGVDQWLFIETTNLGASIPRDPDTVYDEEFAAMRARGAVFRRDSIHSFEDACEAGLATVYKQIEAAKGVLAEVRQMEELLARNRNNPDWMAAYRDALRRLADQIVFVPVSLARKNGVKPVGAPSNLDQMFRIPPRR